MKTFCVAALCAMTFFTMQAGAAPDLPCKVQFEVGDSEFDPGDHITIQQMHGTSPTIAVGGTYSVDGTYTLASHDKADLCFFTTCVSNNGSTPVSLEQELHVKKGSGSFHLVEKMTDDGYFHVSFYRGNSFGGVYFGQGDRVLRYASWLHSETQANDEAPSGPNKTLFEFLGKPVAPPPDMDARYSKEGLMSAILLAAQNAKITIKKIEIDDSEFPSLVGVICARADAAKLKSQLKKMDGYEYGGAVGNDSNRDGSDTCNTFSIVPHRAYPRDASQRIEHRLMLRQQVFYARLSAQE